MGRLVAIRDHAGCRICSAGSEKRAAADALIVRQGEKDAATGDAITWPWILQRLPLILGHSVSKSSIRRHVDNHCRRVEDGEETAAAADESTDGAVELPADMASLLGELDRALEDGSVSPIGLLSAYLRAGAMDLRRRVAAGERIPLTPDQINRIAASLTKVEKDSERTRLIAAMAGAAGALGAPGPVPELVDYEVVQENPELVDGGPEEAEEGGEDA